MFVRLAETRESAARQGLQRATDSTLLRLDDDDDDGVFFRAAL